MHMYRIQGRQMTDNRQTKDHFCPRSKCLLSTLRTDKNFTERKCYTCGVYVTDTIRETRKNEDK